MIAARSASEILSQVASPTNTVKTAVKIFGPVRVTDFA